MRGSDIAKMAAQKSVETYQHRSAKRPQGKKRTICGYRPRHANFSVAQREDFGRVGEGHRTFSRTIECSKYKDESGDYCDAGLLVGDERS